MESNARALATLAEELDAFLARLLCGSGATFSGASRALPCAGEETHDVVELGERKTNARRLTAVGQNTYTTCTGTIL